MHRDTRAALGCRGPKEQTMTLTFASTPTNVVLDPASSIPGILSARVATSGDRPLFERKSSLGEVWTPVTARAFDAEVLGVAKGLISEGISVGDRVAIMARTSYEWTVLDFAVWAVGAVAVPVYETSSAEQVRWIASDSGVRLAVVETAAHAAVVAQAQPGLPGLTKVLVLDDDALGHLTAAGADVPDTQVRERSAALRADDLATIIYTSGTTGRPKGAELTRGNFVFLTASGAEGLKAVCAMPHSRTLLFMPLAHVFARFIQVLCVHTGAVLGHTDTTNLVADLGSFRPTFILAVPRVFEKVYNSAEQKAGSGTRLKLFRWAAKTAIVFSRALDTPAGPSLALRLQHRLADRLVLHKLRAALGGSAEFAVSGGAPLGERLSHFYCGLGLQVLEGYGLTETTAPSSVNRPGKIKVGTVGPPFPGVSFRIADDGEIEISGQHVFRGYHNNAEATRESLVDGWFRTGDIGSPDEDGYLTITGRKKEIIVTAGGKNVAPALLEDRLRGHLIVSQVVVVGDQKPFIAALVTLDAEMLPGWLAARGIPQMTVEDAAKHPEGLAALDKAVERANEAVSRAESIRKIKVLTTDFTEANGFLTPSLKVKRAEVHKAFAAEIEGIYS